MFSDLELMAFKLQFLNRIFSIIDYYLRAYENILAISNFNLSVDKSHLEAFMQVYDFSTFIKKPTCYQSKSPSCIHLILTNRKSLFKLSNSFETGLSDHHKIVCTILKSAPNEKICRSYKTFDVNNFRNSLKFELEKVKS